MLVGLLPTLSIVRGAAFNSLLFSQCANVLRIHKIDLREDIPLYQLSTLKENQPIRGFWYRAQLVAVKKNINKNIIDQKTTKTSKQVLVKRKKGKPEWVNIDQVLGL